MQEIYGNDKMERLEYMNAPDDYTEPETMQERADEIRKDDSMPEPEVEQYWFDVTVDQSSVLATSLEEAEKKIKEVIALGVDYEVYEISEPE